jgi:hypothetical protein
MNRLTVILAVVFAGTPESVLGQAMFMCESSLTGVAVVPPTGSPGGASLNAHFAACAECYPCENGAPVDSLEVILRYQLLAGTPTGASIRVGQPGENGVIYRQLSAGYFASGDTLYGHISPEDCGSLTTRAYYVVIETDAFPNGEVRGQLNCFVTPTEDRSWGSIRAVFR